MTSSQILQDPDLTERIRSRDRDALGAVIDAYLNQVVRAARGAGLSQHQAEEVAQNTFTTFVEKADSFEGRSHIRTWVFGILYHKIREARRGFAKDRAFDDIDEVFESRFDETSSWSRPPRGPEHRALDKEIGGQIGECLDTAPERQRLAFVLREVEGLSTSEICNILDVTSTNLGVMLHRLRNRVRECLEGKWAEDRSR